MPHASAMPFLALLSQHYNCWVFKNKLRNLIDVIPKDLMLHQSFLIRRRSWSMIKRAASMHWVPFGGLASLRGRSWVRWRRIGQSLQCLGDSWRGSQVHNIEEISFVWNCFSVDISTRAVSGLWKSSERQSQIPAISDYVTTLSVCTYGGHYLGLWTWILW